MNFLRRLLCRLTWHDWEYETRDNFRVLVRRCACGARQRRVGDDSIAPTEYWADD